jgi:FkbM family methyltransferase
MSKRYGLALAAMVRGLTVPQHPWRRASTRLLAANALFQTHEVATRHGTLVFVSTHTDALQFPRELNSREPETIDWIDRFEVPCTFWDIGANVGVYTLYAALRHGISTLAFEPSPASYAALCRNIEVNGQGERVAAYCVALCGSTRLGMLNMSATEAGNSFNSFESTEDCFGKPLAIRFRQSMIGFKADEFRRLFGLAPPRYIKIDVDGIEEEILAGAAETLTDPELRSVLVELEGADTARNGRIIERLDRAGFELAWRGRNPAGSANGIFTRPKGWRRHATAIIPVPDS